MRKPRIAAVAVAVYLVVMSPLGCGRWLADAVLLHPSRDELPTFGAESRLIDTPVGAAQVFVARSSSAIGRRPARHVLVLVGNAGRAEYYATRTALRWGDEPTEVWAMNWPGFGQSEGRATLGDLVPAASAAYDAMAEAAGDGPLYLDCDSMGTTVGLRLAAEKRGERPVAGIVAKNPPPLRSLIVGRFGWWNLWLAAGPIALSVPAELDSVANARRAWCPAVFVQAEDDGVVPTTYQDKVIDAYAGRKRVVVLAGADHNDPIDGEEELRIREAIARLMTR